MPEPRQPTRPSESSTNSSPSHGIPAEEARPLSRADPASRRLQGQLDRVDRALERASPEGADGVRAQRLGPVEEAEDGPSRQAEPQERSV